MTEKEYRRLQMQNYRKDKHRIHVDLTKDQSEHLNKLCSYYDLSYSSMIRMLIGEKLGQLKATGDIK